MPSQPQTAFLEALGWTLLNSWWQLGLLWVVMLLVKKIWPRVQPAFRYNLALFLLLTGIAWALLTFILRLQSPGSLYPHFALNDNQAASLYARVMVWVQVLLPYLSIVYLAWLTVRVIRFWRMYQNTRLLRAEGLYKAPVTWRLFAGEMAAHMNIGRKATIWLSEKVDGPLLLGWVKPMILLPFSAVSQLSADQVEAILIHELAHIRRNDFFWNLVVALGEILFFYNPFARQLILTIREEREHACDDWVMQFRENAESYATALLKLEQQRQIPAAPLLLAAAGTHRQLLLHRVKRMLHLPVAAHEAPTKLGVLLGATLLLVTVALVEPRQEISQFLNEVAAEPVASLENRVAYFDALPLAAVTPAPAASAKPASSPKMESPSTGKTAQPATTESTPEMIWDAPAFTVEPALALAVSDEASTYTDEAAARQYATGRQSYSFVHPESPARYPKDAAISEYLPYVPPSSFETVVNDSLDQLLKSAQSKQAVLQVQLALKQLDWDKLQNKLKRNGVSVDQLRFELEKELSKLDWNELTRESDRLLKKLERKSADLLEAQARREKALEDQQRAAAEKQMRVDSLRAVKSKKNKTIYF